MDPISLSLSWRKLGRAPHFPPEWNHFVKKGNLFLNSKGIQIGAVLRLFEAEEEEEALSLLRPCECPLVWWQRRWFLNLRRGGKEGKFDPLQIRPPSSSSPNRRPNRHTTSSQRSFAVRLWH